MTNIKENPTFVPLTEQYASMRRAVESREKALLSSLQPMWVEPGPTEFMRQRATFLVADIQADYRTMARISADYKYSFQFQPDDIVELYGGLYDDESYSDRQSGLKLEPYWYVEGAGDDLIEAVTKLDPQMLPESLAAEMQDRQTELDEPDYVDDEFDYSVERAERSGLVERIVEMKNPPEQIHEQLRAYWRAVLQDKRYRMEMSGRQSILGFFKHGDRIAWDSRRQVAVFNQTQIPFETPAEFAAFQRLAAMSASIDERVRGASLDDIHGAWRKAGGGEISGQELGNILTKRLADAGFSPDNVRFYPWGVSPVAFLKNCDFFAIHGY